MPTLFTFGYHGWGNHTPKLVEAVDAVEAGRGFEPPLFVDIRIRRTVRAKGFQGAAFEKLVGPDRYCWMNQLGNQFILTGSGPRIQIAEPSAAAKLLDLALASAKRKRRLIFFCSCPWPRCDGRIACHRATVAGLVSKVAIQCSLQVDIVEWPGGTPRSIDLDVVPQILAAVKKGRATIPLGKRPDLAVVAGLPWCSTATLSSKGEKLLRFVGPAIAWKDGWALPIMDKHFDPSRVLNHDKAEQVTLRKSLGVEASD